MDYESDEMTGRRQVEADGAHEEFMAFLKVLRRGYESVRDQAMLAERARIRRELLGAIIADETWTYVPARGERLKVLSADALRAHLDRIVPGG